MSYEVREATPLQVGALIQEVLDTSAFVGRRSDGVPFVVEAAEVFGDHPLFRVFALTDGQSPPIGFVMVIPGDDEASLEIGPTYVTRRYRGRGLGKYMLARVVDWARRAGVRRLAVATWGGNALARHVFEAVGFRFTHEEPNTRVDGDSTVHFALELLDTRSGAGSSEPGLAAPANLRSTRGRQI